MTRNSLEQMNCSIANALELIGEGWTILILREAFFGTRRFEDFQQQLGIARNILTTRLKKLCDHGILKRVPVHEGARRQEYRLTAMGRDLYPTLIALTQWGDRWLHQNRPPVKFVERETGEEIADVAIMSKDHRVLDARDLALLPGPGATGETRKRLKLLHETWLNHQQDQKRAEQ
jgi:DNA-binding HxlR family transcriptional regulator